MAKTIKPAIQSIHPSNSIKPICKPPPSFVPLPKTNIKIPIDKKEPTIKKQASSNSDNIFDIVFETIPSHKLSESVTEVKPQNTMVQSLIIPSKPE